MSGFYSKRNGVNWDEIDWRKSNVLISMQTGKSRNLVGKERRKRGIKSVSDFKSWSKP